MDVLQPTAQRHRGVYGPLESATRPAWPPTSLCVPLPQQWIFASKVECGGLEWPTVSLTSELELERPTSHMVV